MNARADIFSTRKVARFDEAAPDAFERALFFRRFLRRQFFLPQSNAISPRDWSPDYLRQ